MTESSTPWLEYGWVEHTQILLNSYAHWLRTELVPRSGDFEDEARTLFEAPVVVVSHGKQGDPILSYANRRALELWEMDIPTLLRTPSRLTAEPMHRDDRARLLERSSQEGHVDDYRGVRISASGRRFSIEEAIVWNLLDAKGERAGQAATFLTWKFLDD